MKKTIGIWFSLLLIGAFTQIAAAQSWTPNGPLPRTESSAVFDPSTRQMIIYGGQVEPTNSTQVNLGDVWRLLPSASLAGVVQNWVAVHPSGTPPAARYNHSSGYDPGSNQMIIFGGVNTNVCLNDVWVLTNANGNGVSAWNQLSPVGGPPPARGSSGGGYDPVSNTLMIYGGADCSGHEYSDYWVLSHANGLGGTPTWNQLFPAGGPGPRSYQTMVYDPTSNELIQFSGYQNGTDYNDVWVLTNANGTTGVPAWGQLFPVGTPPQARYISRAIYDPVSNRMTVFGGLDAGSSLGDTWVLTNANGTEGTAAWIQIAQSSVVYPAPRFGPTAVYDASRNVMIVFSGDISLSQLLMTNDVFFLSHANGL